MPKVDMLKLKELETLMIPGMLKAMRKNGVKELPETEGETTRRSELADQYRKWFYQTPRGIAAFGETSPEEALFVSRKTFSKAESFHLQHCLMCHDSNGLGLRGDGWNYYFTCPKCKDRV